MGDDVFSVMVTAFRDQSTDPAFDHLRQRRMRVAKMMTECWWCFEGCLALVALVRSRITMHQTEVANQVLKHVE